MSAVYPRAVPTSAWSMLARALTLVLVVGTTVALVVSFERRHYLPVRPAVFLLFFLAVAGALWCRFAPFSPLTRLMIVLYASPFAVCAGYLFIPYYMWWYTPGALWYMGDPVTVEIMMMTGLIGLWGLLVGYMLAARRQRHPASIRPTRVLRPVPFMAILLLAVFFSYINTPPDTILSSLYSAARGLAGRFNFNAAYLVAYTLLMLLLVDAEQDRQRKYSRLWKRAAVLGATAFIVVVFQVLRGDRDSLGYLIGVAALLVTEPLPPGTSKRVLKRRVLLLGGVGILVLAAFFAVGEARNRFAIRQKVTLSQAITKGVTEQFTGTAVLLTNLSLAHSFRSGIMPEEGGRTYLQYVLSLPPGFITQALGVERPLEIDRGPNFWFTDISAGGIHIVTVPFRNFRAPGAFLILCLIGYMVARSEQKGQEPRWYLRLWYGSMFIVSAQWFWYGDIVFIREVMSFGIAVTMYAALRRVSAFSTAVHGPAREN